MSYDLGIDIENLMSEGPPATVVEAVRPLRASDLAALDGPHVAQGYEVKRISERHHALARAIASGMKDKEAAAVVGYVPQMVVILRQSPAFIDLVSLYTDNIDAQFSELTGRIAGLTKDAVNELQQRLEEEPEKFSNSTLLDMAKTFADRAGYAPVQRTETTVNVSLSEKLAAARQRVESMIDVTPIEVEPTGNLSVRSNP